MKKISIILLVLSSIITFYSCEKDESKAVLKKEPVAPVISFSDLTFQRSDASNQLSFEGTKADFGFNASVTYRLEADVAGNNFADAIVLATNYANTFSFSVVELNALFLNFLPEDETSNVDMRVTADLGIADKTRKTKTVSDVSTIKVTTYGLPKIVLTTADHKQKLVSPAEDGIYNGWFYTDGAGFTLTADDGKVYGKNGKEIAENGNPFVLDVGAYTMDVDLNKKTYSYIDQTICVIGDAVRDWDNDTKMTWDFADETWNITIEVASGGLKFRSFGRWADVNVAYDPDGHDLNNLYQANSRDGSGDSHNIDDIEPGKYNIKLYLKTKPMKAVFTPVN